MDDRGIVRTHLILRQGDIGNGGLTREAQHAVTRRNKEFFAPGVFSLLNCCTNVIVRRVGHVFVHDSATAQLGQETAEKFFQKIAIFFL